MIVFKKAKRFIIFQLAEKRKSALDQMAIERQDVDRVHREQVDKIHEDHKVRRQL